MPDINETLDDWRERLLRLANVVGVGIGEKSGRPAVIVFVTRKVPLDALPPSQVIPAELVGHPTDVVPIGVPSTQERDMATKRSENQPPENRGPELVPEVTAALADQKEQAVVDILDGGYPNVVGVGIGMKWTGGQPTGRPAVLVLVDQKIDAAGLPTSSLVPAAVAGTPTDVVAIGDVVAGYAGDALDTVAAQTLATRQRPARPGYSVGHVDVTAGTIGAAVYDLQPGGLGVPPRYYLLSNNHVLANTNAARIGDPVLQPGRYDGGALPGDLIGRLSRYVPITLEPAVPRALHRNLVDAAVAEVAFSDLDRNPYWISGIAGWRPRGLTAVGQVVQKTGRTTNYTTGRIIATNATIDVAYNGGRIGRFLDQVVTTPMSAGGDSGSLVSTLDGVAMGLLFAGSAASTIICHIEYVRALLRVEIAERVLP